GECDDDGQDESAPQRAGSPDRDEGASWGRDRAGVVERGLARQGEHGSGPDDLSGRQCQGRDERARGCGEPGDRGRSQGAAEPEVLPGSWTENSVSSSGESSCMRVVL
ncbi:MAG: hypothetical protein E6375_01435, partial [Dermabacter sp.]|nr:hypothetical protein [Dermabacter sp.]